jgi:HEAT repeats
MTEVERWITQLHASSYELRLEASERLVALGEAAVPALTEVACSPKVVARMRAMEALAQIGDRRAFWPLVELIFAEEDYDLVQLRMKALTAIAERLGQQPTRSDAPWFIAILRKFRSNIYARPVAVAAAQGALRLAQTEPCAELMPVLALLKGNFFYPVPPEFGTIRKALAPLLAPWKDLPIAATEALLEDVNLPLPSEEPR